MILEDFLQPFIATLSGGSLVSYGLAFIAGIIACGVCPCTVPMGLGMAGVVSSRETESKNEGLPIAVSFFCGIVLNLTLLGFLAGHLGNLLTEVFGRYWAFSMALISLIAAFFAFWGPRIRTTRLSSMRIPGIAGAFIYGFIFSLGTSVAPLLLLLAMAASQSSPEFGLGLAFFFGVGRGLPFLCVGLFASTITRFAQLSFWRRWIQFLTGGSLLFVSGYYARTFFALL